jgi:hypothetical protein
VINDIGELQFSHCLEFLISLRGAVHSNTLNLVGKVNLLNENFSSIMASSVNMVLPSTINVAAAAPLVAILNNEFRRVITINQRSCNTSVNCLSHQRIQLHQLKNAAKTGPVREKILGRRDFLKSIGGVCDTHCGMCYIQLQLK